MESDLVKRLRKLYEQGYPPVSALEEAADHIEAQAKEIAELKAALSKAATIAHQGGLVGMAEGDALNAIRRVTLPYWDKAANETARAALGKAAG